MSRVPRVVYDKLTVSFRNNNDLIRVSEFIPCKSNFMWDEEFKFIYFKLESGQYLARAHCQKYDDSTPKRKILSCTTTMRYLVTVNDGPLTKEVIIKNNKNQVYTMRINKLE